MRNEDEGFEDWDADFLDQLIQVEELALSSTANNANPIPNPSSTYCPPLLSQQVLQPLVEESRDCPTSYSPPRELSQRAPDFGSYTARSYNASGECGPSSSTLAPCLPRPDAAKELEILDLKRELGRVSKQLKDLEHECVELRMKRNKQEEQLKIVSSNDVKGFIDHHLSKSTTDLRKVGKDGEHNGRKIEVLPVDPGAPHTGEQVKKAHNSAGVLVDEKPVIHDLSKKLQVFWVSRSDTKMGQNLVSELLLSCETDFHVLFGCTSTKLSSKFSVDSLGSDKSYDAALKNLLHFRDGPEAIKLSNLYTTLTKVSNGIVKMEALFTPLLDLCNLGNVVVVHRSLHILHVFLKRLLSLERKSERRKTVMIEGLGSRNKLVDSHGSENVEGEEFTFMGVDDASHAGHAPAGIRLSDAEIVCKNRHSNNNISLASYINWVPFFELMHQIARTHCVECVRVEAVSIMNLILMRNNTYMEREKFGETLLFESVLEFIRKESGLCVQNHAVRLLFLILNCPKFFVAFCSGCKEGEATGAADDNGRCATSFQKFSVILHGLADCLTCCGNGIEKLQLRRNTVLLLAFLASSGKPGFEILISNKMSVQSSFLMLILQVVVVEVDRETQVCPEPHENLRERALLIREVLILLNRLASHSLYSATVLRVLTNREMASLTIDVINKLSRNISTSCQFDRKTRQMMESELADLAQVFKKRVFTYLGNSI